MTWMMLAQLAMADAPDLTPDRRGRARPDRHFDIESLTLDVTLRPADQALDGQATYALRRLSPGPLVLDQVDLDIQRVTADGQDATWWIEGDTLRVELPSPVPEHSLTIQWSATPRAGMYFRGLEPNSPDDYPEVWTQGQDNDHRYWLPLYDHPDDRFALETTVTAPDGWKVLTNTGLTLPGYLIMIAAAPYDVHTHPEDARFSVWVPPGSDETAVAGVLDELPQMNAWFEEKTGQPYAWGEYRQVFVQRFLYGGMENTSATVQNLSLLQPAAVDENAGDWTREVVAHELAHQWYGDLLTCRDWRERWLNEGFAEFMAGAWMVEVEGPAREAERVASWIRGSMNSGPLAGRFFHPDGTRDSGAVYSKGAMVLHMLQQLLGEDLFWEGMKQYTAQHQHRTVITSDFQRALEDVSGHNLDWFFQQWVELAHIPTLKVSHNYAEETLTVRIAQGEEMTYTLPVAVEVGLESGEVQRAEGWLVDGSLQLHVELDAPPRYVAFDPDGALLAVVEQEQDPEDWAEQLDSPSAYARLRAVKALADTSLSEPLQAWMMDRSRVLLERNAAAEALGKQCAEEVLIPGLADPSPGLRAAVARALERGNGDDAAAALAQAVRSDPDPYVRAAALSALARRKPEQAAALARQHIRPRDRTEERLASNAAAILGEYGRPSDLRVLLQPGPGRLWSRYIDAATQIVLNLDDGTARDRAQDRAARAFEAALQEGDLRVRNQAAAALGKLGDPDSIPPLETLRREETVGYIRATASRSINQIRAGGPEKPTSDNALDARLRALEERLDAAEEELDVLRDRH